jgi:hypothetical protein
MVMVLPSFVVITDAGDHVVHAPLETCVVVENVFVNQTAITVSVVMMDVVDSLVDVAHPAKLAPMDYVLELP